LFFCLHKEKRERGPITTPAPSFPLFSRVSKKVITMTQNSQAKGVEQIVREETAKMETALQGLSYQYADNIGLLQTNPIQTNSMRMSTVTRWKDILEIWKKLVTLLQMVVIPKSWMQTRK